MSPVTRGSVARSRNHRSGRDEEDLLGHPSLLEFLLEIERNKRETNRLLARIEKNTTF